MAHEQGKASGSSAPPAGSDGDESGFSLGGGGVRQHLGFKASVVKLRTRYPRIHVRYEADRAGNTGRINLPEMREAYLMADAVAEYDGA